MTDLRTPRPDDPFLMTDARTWSYGDLYALASTWNEKITSLLSESSAIARTGETIKPGTFLILRSLDREALLLHIACAWISRVPILPLDPAMPASELESLSATLLWDGALVDEPGALPSIGLIHESPAVGAIEEIYGWLAGSARPDPLPDPDHLTRAANAWWGALLTSGSSGPRKLVPHQRRSWIHAVEDARSRTPMAPGESWLLPLPLHHAGGMNVILRALLTGSAILLSQKGDPGDLARLIRNHPELRAASMVPTQLGRLLNEPELPVPTPFHGILLGGGPIRESLLQRATDRGLPVIASYGMTETVGQIASRIHPAGPERETGATRPQPTRSGSAPEPDRPATPTSDSDTPGNRPLPIPGPHPPSTPPLHVHRPHEIRVLGEEGPVSEAGTEGQLQIRGPQLFQGYLEGRKLQRNRFDDDGWFSTGDWVRLHPADDGTTSRLEILSRRTDLILSGGENIQPGRVEMVLETLPEIQEALVVGVEDPDWGERVVALVIPDPAATGGVGWMIDMNETGTLSDSLERREWIHSIQERIAEKLTPAERPKEIFAVHDLPTLGPGKRDRKEAAAQARRMIDQTG